MLDDLGLLPSRLRLEPEDHRRLIPGILQGLLRTREGNVFKRTPCSPLPPLERLCQRRHVALPFSKRVLAHPQRLCNLVLRESIGCEAFYVRSSLIFLRPIVTVATLPKRSFNLHHPCYL